jgi:hypothetical protein
MQLKEKKVVLKPYLKVTATVLMQISYDASTGRTVQVEITYLQGSLFRQPTNQLK